MFICELMKVMELKLLYWTIGKLKALTYFYFYDRIFVTSDTLFRIYCLTGGLRKQF